MGDIPAAWLQEQNLEACAVCSRLLSRRYGGACPRCRPILRQGQAAGTQSRPLPPDWPSLDQVVKTHIPTRVQVPLGARKVWAQCLAAAVSDARTHNDEKAWVQLLALPKMVLRVPDRGGKKNKKRNAADVQRSCEAWLEGQRASLWNPSRRVAISRASDEINKFKEERCAALIKESLYRKACGTLVREPPVAVTTEVRSDMSTKHPAPRAVEAERRQTLRDISPQAAPVPTPESVEKAIRSFPRPVRLATAAPKGRANPWNG